eukprot:5382407-Amphidinium_carterae.1
MVCQDMMQSDAHFTNYCGYALALGRHKLLDRLSSIKTPALVLECVCVSTCTNGQNPINGKPRVSSPEFIGKLRARLVLHEWRSVSL